MEVAKCSRYFRGLRNARKINSDQNCSVSLPCVKHLRLAMSHKAGPACLGTLVLTRAAVIC